MMNSERKLSNLLKECLKKTGHFVEKEFYYITRCPFCGDSKKHLINHGHLYLYKGSTFFKCYRCDVSGNIKKVFKEYLKKDIISYEQYDNIIKLYEKLWGNYPLLNNDKIIDSDSVMLKYTKPKIIYGAKLSYISDRFNAKHTDLCSNNQIEKYRIILDLEEFFNKNKYLLYSRYNFIYDKKDYIQYLNSNYVGFLSKLNTKIILRSINHKTTKRRYIVYSINSFFSNIDFYSYCSLYDLYLSDTLIVSEGIFDICNSKLNKYFNKDIPKLALLGKSRFKNLNKIIKSIKFRKYKHLIVLLDKDLIKERFHLKHILSNAAYKITLYANKIGKDFGEKNIVLEKL